MPADKARDVLNVSEIGRRSAENFGTFYVNNANVASAFYDLSIMFSEIQSGPGEAVVLDKCRVTMSPAHAKALALALAENIRRWEAQFGEIRLPEGMVTTGPNVGGAKASKKDIDRAR